MGVSIFRGRRAVQHHTGRRHTGNSKRVTSCCRRCYSGCSLLGRETGILKDVALQDTLSCCSLYSRSAPNLPEINKRHPCLRIFSFFCSHKLTHLHRDEVGVNSKQFDNEVTVRCVCGLVCQNLKRHESTHITSRHNNNL